MEMNVLSTIICFEVWFLESCEFAPFLREDIFLATRKSVKPKENGKKNTTYSESRACFLAWCQCRISPLQGQAQTYPNFFQVRTTVAEGAFPSKRKERKNSVHSITDNNNKILIQVVILQNYTYYILLLLSISGAKEKKATNPISKQLKKPTINIISIVTDIPKPKAWRSHITNGSVSTVTIFLVVEIHNIHHIEIGGNLGVNCEGFGGKRS